MRLKNLRKALREQELDAIVITRPESQRYLSGFTGGEALLLITQKQALLLTDFRYYEQVAEEAPAFQLVKLEKKLPAVFKGLFHDCDVKTVGFESTHVSYSDYHAWKAGTRGTKWVATKDVVEDLRMIKDPGELVTIRKAVAIADAACDYIRDYARAGMTEKQIAWELEAHMRTHGAEAVAFTFIVGSGPNGAKPHAVVQDRQIQAGEPIVMDIGARVDGYNSDLTRTICIGKPDSKLQEIYDIVLHAQLAAEKEAKPGMTGREIDAIARKVITDAGYGEQFGHSLGHGVGLAVHEKPGVSPKSDQIMQPNMVVTFEPGIYLSEWGGVRIEDMGVFTKDSVEIPTKAHKELRAR